MATGGDVNSTPISSAQWLILGGVCLTVAGAFGNFQLERHSFASTTDFEFFFLSGASFPALLLGLITTLIGSVLWARCAAIRHVALYGLGIVILLPLGLAFIPINIHGWTAVFLFVGLVGILIGGLFLLFAGVRAFIRRGANS